jgi:hypothetical protein
MKRLALLIAAATAAAWALNATPAFAQAVRTFVSGHGTDSGICGVGAPCRTFAFAIGQTAAGGEIAVLDSAGYGIVTISKAISITNEQGVEAAITVTTGDGITVSAGASDTVNLTGITLTGGGGHNGITFTSGGTLNIKNCVARGFTLNGLNLTPGASSQFNVSDTIVSNNAEYGVLVQPTGSGTVSALFERVQAIGNSLQGVLVDGEFSTGTLQATATNSDASGNAIGFFVFSLTGQAVTTFTIVNSTAVNNQGGLESSGPNATMFVAGTTVSGNAVRGFAVFPPAVMKTFGNNNITDTTNIGTLTLVTQQ